MVTFRCKRSGNTVKFYDEGDIAGLRSHDGYEEVIEDGKETENSKSDSSNPNESKDDGEKRETNAGNEEKESKVLAKKRGRKPSKK